jgi:hypothetical protein
MSHLIVLSFVRFTAEEMIPLPSLVRRFIISQAFGYGRSTAADLGSNVYEKAKSTSAEVL